MRVRSKVHALGLPAAAPEQIRLLCLAVCMVLGMIAGGIYAGRCGDDGFSAYLTDFCALWADGSQEPSLLSAVRLYFGYTALAFLLGFASLGVLLIPLLSVVYGFVSMFAVSCFVSAFGRSGAVLAMGAMGLRQLFVLPCFLWVSAWAWMSADRLLGLALGKGKRCSPVMLDGNYWYRLCLCVVILLIGLGAELYVTPRLLGLIVARIAI